MKRYASPAAVLLSLLACLLALPTHAQKINQFESKNYIIHTDFDAKDIKPFAQHMDAVFDEFKRRFKNANLGRERTRGKENLYLLTTRQAYVSLLQSKGIDGSNSGGIFFRRGNETGLATWVLNKPRQETIKTLQHEGFHQFASRFIAGQLPLWVNEGLAVYFEQARLVKGKFKIGAAEPGRIEEIKNAIANNKDFPIQSIVNISSEQWFANLNDPERGSLQYTQSWSLCHFLIHADKGRYQKAFNRYLAMLGDGQRNQQAFEKAFGTGNYDALHQAWQTYINEDIEPDEYSLVINRMEFLAFAAQSIRARGEKLPETLDEFKARLKSSGFRVRMGEGVILDSSDDALYTYPDAKGNQVPFDYKLNKDGLPNLRATKAKPSATVQWTELAGQLSYEIKYR